MRGEARAPGATSSPRPDAVARPSGGGRQRTRVAMLLDQLEDEYEWEVLRGAVEVSRARGVQLLAFVGSELGRHTLHNQLFELVGPRNADAIVVLAAALSNQVGLEALRGFVARYAPLPSCSVGAELPEACNLLVDDAAGMLEAVDHLARVHGARRIAFVDGPPTNVEAQRRRRAFLSGLARHGLRAEPELMVAGAFSRASGQAAVEALLAGPGLDAVDAIVACDDYTALGVVDGLASAGLSCPEHVAVVGFDDLPLGREHRPSLATVSQPLQRLGALALSSAADMANGRCAPSTELTTRFVAGQSCGCAGRWSSPPAAPDGPSRDEGASARASLRRHIGERLDVLGSDWDEQLVADLFAELSGERRGAFKRTFYGYATNLVPLEVELEVLHDVLSILQARASEHFPAGSRERERLEELCHELRLYLGAAIERAQVRRRVRAEQALEALRSTSDSLISSFQLEQLAAALASALPRLGIPRLYLVVYRGPHCQLLLALDERRPRGELPHELLFDPDELVPGSVWPEDAHAYLLKPLFIGQEALGYLVLSVGACAPAAYETLREQVSATVKGAELRRQRDGMAGFIDQVAALRGKLRQGDAVDDVVVRLERILEEAAELRLSFSRSPAQLKRGDRSARPAVRQGRCHDDGKKGKA